MRNVSLLIVIIGCLLIFYQDIRDRLIHVGSVIVLAGGLVLLNFKYPKLITSIFVINVVFLIFLFLTVTLYFWLRTGEKKLINKFIGLGDVLVFIVFCLAYNLYNYTLFILIGCFTGVLFWGFRTLIWNEKKIKVPLAGLLAIVHLISIITCFYFSYDPLSDQYLIF